MSDEDTPAEGTGEGEARAMHVQPVEGNATPVVVSPAHVTELHASGLTDETIRLSGIYSEGTSAPIAEILGRRWARGGGYVIPFRGFEHNRVIGKRVKPDNPRTVTRDNGRVRVIKYDQRYDTPALAYFGPRSISEARFMSTTHVNVWTEGEKKALLLDQMGFAAVGLTGVHNFHDAEKFRNGDGLAWSTCLARFAERCVKDFDHVLVFDADSFENEHVMLALRRLAGLLLASGARSVSAVRIPLEENATDRKIGIDDYYAAHGEEKTRALFRSMMTVRDDGDIAPLPPRDPLVQLKTVRGLKDARLPGNLRLPPRFSIHYQDRSVWFTPPGEDAEPKEMMPSVLIPTRLLRDSSSDEQRVEVSYYARGEWHREVMERKAMRDARRLLAEAPSDAAVSSGNNATAVQWLSEFWRHNESRIPTLRYVNDTGWHDVEDESVFACGVVYKRVGSKSHVESDKSGDKRGLVKALTPRGTLEGHENALRRAYVSSPTAAVAILGALGAPLLRPLGAPNFAVHFPGESSRGKTTRVRMAASVYGDPNNAQWLGSWNTTSNAMEFRARGLCDLPLCFDEVGAGDGRVDQSIYMLVNGQGRSRGDRSLSSRKTATWRTIILSTGEHELATTKANAGAQVRVLQFRVTGFEGMGAADIDAMREACERNSGQVGGVWLEAAAGVTDWSEHVTRFLDLKAEFRALANGPLAQRQAAYFAFLAVVEELASDVLGIGDSDARTVRALFAQLSSENEVTASGVRAALDVSSWIGVRAQSFPTLTRNTSGQLKVTGRERLREVFGVRHDGRVLFYPSALRDFLEERGYSAREVMSQWRDDGKLKCSRPDNFTIRIKFDGAQQSCVSVCGSVFELDAESQESISGLDDD